MPPARTVTPTYLLLTNTPLTEVVVITRTFSDSYLSM